MRIGIKTWKRQLTALFHNVRVDPLRDCVAVWRRLLDAAAKRPRARTRRRLATLQLVAIAGYSASLCLARHPLARTLRRVQPSPPG